jgi:hypothetical protein
MRTQFQVDEVGMPDRPATVQLPQIQPANTRSLMTSFLKYITRPCVDVDGPTMLNILIGPPK